MLDWRLLWLLIIVAAFRPSEASPKLDPFGRSIQVAPIFPYYRDRSAESIVSEIAASGYRCVRLAVELDSTDPKLVEEFHKAGIAVWYTTFGNGTYSPGVLPAGCEKWRMKLRLNQPDKVAAGFVYLCMNDPEYREWKKKQVVATLKRIPFDGIEVCESFWPAFRGPESPTYGCLCENCRDAFLRMYPDESDIPEFSDPSDPNYYATNRALYEKWIEFRVRSSASFVDDIINGPGGVRAECPRVKVGVWGIADAMPDAVARMREWEGIDGPLIVKTVHPDLYVLQTDWPDWSNPDLAPDYPLKYKPFVDAIRAASKVTIIMQADVGSFENCRRRTDWMAKCEKAARKAGMGGITSYEYHLTRDIYEAPPRLVSARGSGKTITLTFTKRLDAEKASDTSNYSLDSGRLLSAQADGNLVKLEVSGHPRKITVRNLPDDPSRRLFAGYPAVAMKGEESLPVNWQ